MPKLIAAFSAGEFLDEWLFDNDEYSDGWEIVNPTSLYPFEWWILQ